MTSTRSALILTAGGLLAGCFFWATDPTLGLVRHVMSDGRNLLDAAHQVWPGTLVGLAGSGVVVLTGLWLLTRRSA